MVFLWFLALLSWPVAEIWLFVEVSQAVGWLAVLALTIGSGIAGALLMRIQGYAAMSRFVQNAQEGELPVATVIDGMGIFTAGLLLLLPGFLSDILGLLLFIPPLRRAMTGWLFRRVPERGQGRSNTAAGGRSRGRSDQPAPTGFRRADDVIDAEFETIDPPTGSEDGEQRSGRRNGPGSSPWRRR